MNGIGNEERVAATYGWEHVLYSFMRICVVNWMFYHGIKVLEEKNAGRFER